jgi:REP element-mobilizing transposase RayT
VTWVPEYSQRRNLRLQAYDYAQSGAYFVTVCTQGHACLFGTIVEDSMRLNDVGKMVVAAWEALPDRFQGIEQDAFVVMPNHIHGIIVLVGAGLVPARGGVEANLVPALDGADLNPGDHKGRPYGVGRGPTLGGVVGAFKSITTVLYTRGVRESAWPAFRGRVWQRNFYEHVIRDEDSLQRTREYIICNPLRWSLDRENPKNVNGRDPCLRET